MSDLRVAVVAEGPTDRIVIEAALRHLLPGRFVVSLLQPETDASHLGGFGQRGSGWTGVYRWCRQILRMGSALDAIPFLNHDLIVVHVDADVAGFSYSDDGIDDAPTANLPCREPCPPPEPSIAALSQVIASWLNLESSAHLPTHWALCIPSKCTESWVVATRYRTSPTVMPANLECDKNLAFWLAGRPEAEGDRLVRRKGTELKKQRRIYEGMAAGITDSWAHIESQCVSARIFGNRVRAIEFRRSQAQ